MFKVITNIEELKGKEIKYIELAEQIDDEAIIITKDNSVFMQLYESDEWMINDIIYNKEKINKDLVLCNGNNYLSKLFIKQGLITKEELNNLIELDKERKSQEEFKKKQDKYNQEYQEYLRLKEKFEKSK